MTATNSLRLSALALVLGAAPCLLSASAQQNQYPSPSQSTAPNSNNAGNGSTKDTSAYDACWARINSQPHDPRAAGKATNNDPCAKYPH